MKNKWVLVECISQYRMRYMVEVPEDHPEWALDTVTMEEAKEFSQHWLGETIFSHRVIEDEQTAVALCRADNTYIDPWNDDQVKNAFFTTWKEQQPDDIEHSEYYYDTDRNR